MDHFIALPKRKPSQKKEGRGGGGMNGRDNEWALTCVTFETMDNDDHAIPNP